MAQQGTMQKRRLKWETTAEDRLTTTTSVSSDSEDADIVKESVKDESTDNDNGHAMSLRLQQYGPEHEGHHDY